MEKRSENILNAVIETFIRTGEPVSSGWLYRNYNFGIKPAMIRHELEDLTRGNYLEQPYRSAGRTPSDCGYEFFVDQVLSQDLITSPDSSLMKPILNANWLEFLDLFSFRLGLLAALEPEEGRAVYKSGLEALLNNLDWENHGRIKEIVHDFEELDSRINELDEKIFQDDPLQIFIGRKSPVTESEELSVIAEQCRVDGENFLVFAIGPKRMNYKKVVRTFRGLKKIGENARRKSSSIK